MAETILKIIGLILVTSGVILIYDARSITKKFFSFGDQNDASLGLKLLGYLIGIIGGLILYFNF